MIGFLMYEHGLRKNHEYPAVIGTIDSVVGKVELVLISNGPLFWELCRPQAMALLGKFEQVQDSVWNKSHSTLNNSFKIGSLLYFSVKGVPIGFISAKHIVTHLKAETIFISDAMIMRQFQGLGLCSLGFKAIQSELFTDQAAPRLKKYCVFLSGHIAPFAHFSNRSLYKRIAYSDLEPDQQDQLYRLAISCGEAKHETIEKNGIVSGVFERQSLEDDQAWPKEAVSKFNLPSTLSYSNGDGLLGIFEVLKLSPPQIDNSSASLLGR